MHSALYTGQLDHRRRGPVDHAFTYPATLAWLDLAELDSVFAGRWFWSTRRPAPAWLRRADYLGDTSIPLHEAVRERVSRETGLRPRGPVRRFRCRQRPLNVLRVMATRHDPLQRTTSRVSQGSTGRTSRRHSSVTQRAPGDMPLCSRSRRTLKAH